MDVKESLIDIRVDDYDIFWGVSDYLGEKFPDLKRRTLWVCDYGLFASPDYLKRFGFPKTPDALDSHKVVGYLHNQPSNVVILQSKNGEPIYKLLDAPVKTVTGFVELACSGAGIINASIDDPGLIKALEKNQLVPVLKEFWYKNATTFVYYHKVKGEQMKVRAFIDFFLEKRPFW